MLLDRKTVREVVEAWAALLWRLEDGPGDDRRGGRLTKMFKKQAQFDENGQQKPACTHRFTALPVCQSSGLSCG